MYRISIDHKEVLIDILKGPANGTCSGYEEQKTTVPIIENISEAKDVITLEELEWKLVADRVRNSGFLTNDREHLTFIEDILNAKEKKNNNNGITSSKDITDG